MQSIWEKENEFQYATKEITKKEWDVIVIGAGISGLLCAYYLQEKGFDVLVLEAKTIGSGQSGKTSAKITSQHDARYATMIKKVGKKMAKLYLEANENAIQQYEELIQKENIDCDFKRVNAYLYTKKDTNILQEEKEALEQLGYTAYDTNTCELPFKIKHALYFKNQAQFSPLKFIYGLAKVLHVVEHSKVIKIKDHTVFCEKDEYTAKYIVVATHYPIINMPGFYFLRQHQERSSMIALSNAKLVKDVYYGVDKNGLSFRSSGKYLLVGGYARRSGEPSKDNPYKRLYKQAKKFYPKCKLEASWSAQDCMPHDKIPFIGHYSLLQKHIYVITGFQKWGMSNAMVAAQIIKDLILEKNNPYIKVFSPQRFHIKAGYSSMIEDTGINARDLYKGWLASSEHRLAMLRKEEHCIADIQGQKCACYKDGEGQLHKVCGQCSHLGGELVFNEHDKIWECPCHGSSFSITGDVLEAPTTKDLENYSEAYKYKQNSEKCE